MPKRTITVWVCTLGLGAALFIGHGAAVAQDASPVPADPAECTVEPRDVDKLVEIFMGGDYVPNEEIAAGQFPDGTPADDETVAAAHDVARMISACANAGDYLRLLALMSDDGVQFFGPEESDATEEDIRGFFAESTVESLPEDEREAYAITDVQLLDDGRIGAVMHQVAPEPGGPTYLILVDVDGQLLVDFIAEVEESSASPEATPTS